MPRRCKGTSKDEPCIFGKDGGAAQPKPGNARCSWCDPDFLKQVLDKPQGRTRLQQIFKTFAPDTRAAARAKLPPGVAWSFPEPQADGDADAEPPAAERGQADRPQPGNREAKGPAQEPGRREEGVPMDGAGKAAPAPGPRHVNLALAEQPADAQAALGAHAASVALFLRPHWIAGDGNCLYRSVALQMPQGEQHHQELRRQSTLEAREHWFRYAHFFPEQMPAAVVAWTKLMERPRHWGDHMSFRAITDYVARPLIVWRQEQPHQPPHCFVPVDHQLLGEIEPIYLRLEKAVAGAEHYTACRYGRLRSKRFQKERRKEEKKTQRSKTALKQKRRERRRSPRKEASKVGKPLVIWASMA